MTLYLGIAELDYAIMNVPNVFLDGEVIGWKK